MDEKQAVDTILKAIELIQKNPNAAVDAARLTVYGMIGAGLISIIGNFFVNIFLIKAETKKLSLQLQTEHKNELNKSWLLEFKQLMADFIYETDIERESRSSDMVMKVTHRITLILDTSHEDEDRLNNLIIELASMINGWAETNTQESLKLQSEIINLSKKIITRKQTA